MLKVTKTIVNGNRSLIGFMIKGKEKELGGFSSNEVEQGMPVDTLIKNKFSNNQISVVNGKIVERGSFKINSLPMMVYVNDQYIDLDNSVNLIGRFVQNNENIGFRVRFADGSEDNLKYANVIMLCKWFKPGNFSIRTSSKGRQYICGKKESINIDELPATVIGEEPKVKAKRTKPAAKDTKPEFNGAIESGFDILDIYGFIKDCNGCVIKLPNEDYVPASIDGSTEDTAFMSLGIGEVASANPAFNATKLNVNADFKKVGVVPVNINGQTNNITTFVYRKKSIFLNGENYMKKFGIAVPVEKEAELVKLLGASLALEKITDEAVTRPLGQVIDAKSLSFYKVDSTKIDLISDQKRKASILSAKQIDTLCRKQYDLKVIKKALGPKGGLMKNIKAALGADAIAESKGKKPFGFLSMFNEDALKAVAEAGINIYNGSYESPDNGYTKKSAASTSEYTPVEIEYIVKGLDANKITGAKILDAVRANDTTKISETAIKIIGEVLSVTDLLKQYEAAEKLYNKVDMKLAEIDKKLWMHNASMYLNGNKSRIHTHDAKNWIPDTSTKVKTANVYMCKTSGLEELTVKFTGVEI